ncbi:DUF6668 family protein [Kineococcus sp. SYSU DK006]|uniref:DUF6668 family protein n=1 Tax=Kineococcus sp. SYSU DK006 TaxID=3383127 RepID=UPI003D7D2250
MAKERPPNRWLTAPETSTEPTQPAAPEQDPLEVFWGPAQQLGTQPVPTGEQLPRQRLSASTAGQSTGGGQLWVLGAHGGAGETSLAAALHGARAAEHRWPVHTDGTTSRVLVCARTSYAGLSAAQRALTDFASGALPGVHLVGLALLADAPGRLPDALRDFAQLVQGGAPQSWHIAWIEEWRTGDTPVARHLPRALRRLSKEVARTPAPAELPPAPASSHSL